MTRLFSLILLLVFASTSILKLGVVVRYMSQFDYYSNVLCVNKEVPESTCHGQCQLNKEISAIDEPNSNQPAPVPNETETSFQFFGVLLNKGSNVNSNQVTINLGHMRTILEFHYHSPLEEIPTPPPQVRFS